LLSFLFALSFSLGAHAATDSSVVKIPFEQYDLDNGLHVILSEDHSVPYVQVNIWYRVGAKDEVEGRSGFAHLFEHLMFQGSEHHDDEYFKPLQRIGALINGTTNTDRTNYFEGVPSEQLPLALWLESDRMGWLLPALTQEKLDNQQLVVRNERRQSYENRPYGMVWWWLAENMYPDGHPYHIPTIGKHEDIDAASLADVKAFFRQWYLPNNASLTICGDFDPKQAKALVEQYFGPIPRGEQPVPVSAASAKLTGETIIRKTDDVPHQKVWVAWHTPGLFAEGDADFDVLSSVLTDGKESRLYKHLVHDLQIAKDVNAFQSSSLLGSIFIVTATAATGHTTDEVVAELDKVLAEVAQTGPSDGEVAIAKTNWEARFFGDLLSISSKANQLNQYYVQTGSPDYIGQDLARYQGVSTESVHAAQKRWITADRLILHIGPESTEEN
jgi:zinc protease